MAISQADLNSPEYWRARAEESRAAADQMKDPGARETMLGIAKGFDDMAARIERLRARNKSRE
jgi:hypothetical protein